MISAEQARALILERVPVLGQVTVSARRAAGRRLAADVVSGSDVPPFDNAAMDGYAVHSSDTASAPVTLTVAGVTAAGDPPAAQLPGGTAREIMTGAPVPFDADAVVQLEWTERAPGTEVRVMRPVSPGANIRRAGSDIAKGSAPLLKGRLVRAFEQGVLASVGAGFVAVHRRPAAYFIPTGNELTEPAGTPGPGKIRDSNSAVVTGLLEREGCDVRRAPITADDPGRLMEAVGSARGFDVLVTTGGVSAGRYDAVPGVLAAAGFEIVFHRVNIKPGMPLLFAVRGATPAFSLPGNPVSAAVTFLEFVRPALRKMSGDPDPGRREVVKARLAAPFRKTDGKRHFVRGRIENVDGEPVVRPARSQDSHAGSALAAADCLIILPEDRSEFGEWEFVDTELL
jgi:molybdopterin molybdotransferase